MSIEATPYDVTVVGGGVAGLMLTKKLAGLGLQTALIEQNPHLADGPSTRNEGWLHRGTYHATSIADRVNAMQVARRCIYGHEQIKNFAPEAVEDIDLPSFALLRDGDKAEEVTSRWDEAGVEYRPVLPSYFSELEPNVKTEGIDGIFQVADLGVNTRVLYRKLLASSLDSGAHVMTDAQLTFESPTDAQVTLDGKTVPHQSEVFVYTAGYGVRHLFESNFDVSMPLRYWKSHLMLAPRLTNSSVFCLDPHEAGMMNHDAYSIIGMNEDAAVRESPDYDVIPEGVENLRGAISRLFRETSAEASTALACIKTDFAEQSEAARSLNISVTEPIENHICVLPGKMTESPYVTDVVTKMVYSRLKDDMIALRPIDTIKDTPDNLDKAA